LLSNCILVTVDQSAKARSPCLVTNPVPVPSPASSHPVPVPACLAPGDDASTDARPKLGVEGNEPLRRLLFHRKPPRAWPTRHVTLPRGERFSSFGRAGEGEEVPTADGVFEGVLLRGGGSHWSGAAEPPNGAGDEVMEQIDPLFSLSVMISAVLLLCLPRTAWLRLSPIAPAFLRGQAVSTVMFSVSVRGFSAFAHRNRIDL
jgi:hypothetical protein